MSKQDLSKQRPYQTLGLRLRKMRQTRQESPADVSGAVEIEPEMLRRIEQGIELPSEDILMLLINHFGLSDDEAVDLWELAGYDQDDVVASGQEEKTHDEPRLMKQPVLLLALDSRIVYSNGVEIVTDQSGIVMNFTQYMDKNQGPVSAARVGMSYAQAAQVLAALQQAGAPPKPTQSQRRLSAAPESAVEDIKGRPQKEK